MVLKMAKIGLSGKELEECRAKIKRAAYQARQNHGAGAAIQKLFDSKAEGLEEADTILYEKIASKMKEKKEVMV